MAALLKLILKTAHFEDFRQVKIMSHFSDFKHLNIEGHLLTLNNSSIP